MSRPPNATFGPRETIDEGARRRFERGWREGQPEPLEAVLPPQESPSYLPTLEELVLIELEFVWKKWRAAPTGVGRRRPTTVEEYLLRFPLLNVPDVLGRLVQQERALRRRCGDNPADDEYQRRFPNVTPASATGPTIPFVEGVLPLPAMPGYEVLCLLARGGMGAVYKARQLALDRVVALKVILAGAHAGADERRRFRSEALAAARLRHPNVVQVLEVGEHDGLPYLALEYVEGGSLDHALQGTPQPAHTAAALVEVLAGAVQHAHEAGIIHRDLKPANVLLARGARQPSESVVHAGGVSPPLAECVPKITDFGLAKMLEGSAGQTHSGAVLGTPSYMAPEQAAGQTASAGPACDVYALGAILYELLTGRPPFKAATGSETILQVIQDEPAPPSRLLPKLPPDLETICLKCLRKEPQQRYGSAAELARELRCFLEGRPIQARPQGRLERLGRWCRRNPALASAAALAAVALAATVLLSIVFALSQAAAKDRAEDLVRDLQQTDRQRRRFTHLSARLVLNQGQARCEQGDVAIGLLMLARGLEIVPADARDVAASLRTALAAWRGQLRPLRAMLPHQGLISTVAFSPDGRTILAATADSMARLWDTATGEPISPPLRHREGRVLAVAFSPDGKMAVTAGDDKTVRRWDAATGRPIGAPLLHASWVAGLAFSPDGKTLLTGSYDGTIRLWDTATGRQRSRAISAARSSGSVVVRTVAFHPDGQTFLTGSDDGAARLWKVLSQDTGAPIGQPMQHKAPILRAGFSPDGKTVLTASQDKTARLWDAATAQPLPAPPLQHQDRVISIAFSPDGKTILTGSMDRTARLWDAATGQPLGPPLRHLYHVQNVAFSPDGKTILTGSNDWTARLWDAATGQPLGAPLQHPQGVGQALFSPDGKTILTGCRDGVVRLWEAGRSRAESLILAHADQVGPVAFSPDGKTILTGCIDGTAQRWDAVTGARLGPPLRHKDRVYAAAFSPDGKTLVTGSWDKTVRLWDAATSKPTGTVFRHDERVFAAVFSPDGKKVLTGSHDNTARLWDVLSQDTGKEIYRLPHRTAVWSVAFSPDGATLLTGGWYPEVSRWNAATGQRIDPPLRHTDGIWSVAFSPDGKTLLTGSWDHTARLWVAATGKPINAPIRHLDRVYGVAFSPAGNRILTGCSDGTIRLWDTATGQALGPPLRHGPGDVNSLAFSPDGRTILSGSDDHTARLWPAPLPLTGDTERIVLWAQVLTGRELDDEGVVRWLNASTWKDRHRQLGLRGSRQRFSPEVSRQLSD